MNASSPIHHYKLKLSYAGTKYSGWQIQLNQKTVQGELNRALAIITKSDDIKSVASGRTDAGVHAVEQVVKVSLSNQIEPAGLMRALNANLPMDIQVYHAEFCTEDFHPIFSCKQKEYRYYFTMNKRVHPFELGMVASAPLGMDIELMAKAVKYFEGEHDFVNYYCLGTPVNSTVRTIFFADLAMCQLLYPGTLNSKSVYYTFTFRGNGFLKQMVRLMVGSLWQLGLGRVTLEELRLSLNQQIDRKLGPVAPPDGLYLHSVSY